MSKPQGILFQRRHRVCLHRPDRSRIGEVSIGILSEEKLERIKFPMMFLAIETCDLFDVQMNSAFS